MPLMVDPSGRPVYAADPAQIVSAPSTVAQDEISTFEPTPIPTPAAASAASYAVDSTLTVTAAAVQATSNERTQAEIIKDQQAIQAGMDNQTPRNLMLAFMAFLLLVMLLSQPRFLARLLASLRRRTKGKKNFSFDHPPHSATPLREREVKRPVGGGDLKNGWFLFENASSTRTTPSSGMSIKSDPFASPFDEVTLASPPTLTPPPHITPLLQHLPFSSTLFYAPFARLPSSFASSISLSELYLILGYLLLNAFALIWRSDVTPTTKEKGYGYDFMRTGLVAMTQMPLAVALGVRGNIIGMCVGKGYEKLKRLHKVVGRVLFLAATLHTMFYFHKFAVAGITLKMLGKPFILAGLLAWIAIMVVALTSIPQIRNAWYGVFKVCHIAGMIMLLVGMCFHVTVAIPWCLASLVIYGVSIVCSLTKTRLAHAELVALSDSRTTIVSIPGIRSGWRAGQHIRIRIPGLGWPAGFQAHPFTIASAPEGEGMVLMCKAVGPWTQALFEFASREAMSSGMEKSTHPRVQATVLVEGPYGGLGNTMLPSFSGLLLTAGGSGITHALALAHDLVTRAPTGVIRARAIDLVWVVRTEDMARPMMPTLLDLVQDARALEERCLEGRKLRRDLPAPVALRIHVHVTRLPASSPITLLATASEAQNPFASEVDYDDEILQDRPGLHRQTSAAEKEKAAYLSRTKVTSISVSSKESRSSRKSYYAPLSDISVTRDRPDFTQILEQVVDDAIDQSRRDRVDGSGVCVTSCGPSLMCLAVRDAVRTLDGKKRRTVGGVELEEEAFGF